MEPTPIARSRGIAACLACALAGLPCAPSVGGAPRTASDAQLAAPAASDREITQVRTTPDALVYGHAATVYLQILAAGQLDGDAAADLIVGELPTGLHGDERTESSFLPGRDSWPDRAGTEALGVRKIVEPVANARDRFGYLGSGDLDGDGGDDLVTVTVKQPGSAGQTVRLGLHLGSETWSGRPNLSAPDVAIDVPSGVVPEAAAVADLGGDGYADLLVSGENGVDVLQGRRPWPRTLGLEPADVHIDPPPVSVRAADVTGDGRADMLLLLGAPPMDAALILGRDAWPATMDAIAAADASMGTGSGRVSGALVPDISGDGLADLIRVDNETASLEVYEGGPLLVDRLERRVPSWAASGISDTFSVAVLDMTGDGIAEISVDHHVIVGRPGRSGTIDVGANQADADWQRPLVGPLWSLDVDGMRGNDVLIADSAGSVPGRRGAGTISIFLSPLFTPGPVTPTSESTPAPSPETPTPSVTPPPTHVPSPTGSVTPGGPARRVWLPALSAGR